MLNFGNNCYFMNGQNGDYEMSIEKMADFFTARVDEYEPRMLNQVEGCADAYVKMAEIVGEIQKKCDKPIKLLDLGCGTGLELDEIFKLAPNIKVTGIDLTQAMLDKLEEKHRDKGIELICGSYFEVPFFINKYDVVISFQTMHHFSKDKKIKLYEKISESLSDNCVYIECDYMVENQSDEDLYFAENARLRQELNISEDEFYHYDTPCTIENQIEMFYKANFSDVKVVFRKENTTMIVAKK